MQLKLNSKKQKGLKERHFTFGLFHLFVLFALTSCSYPTTFLFNKEVLPEAFGDPWIPPKKSMRTAQKIQYIEPIDLNILKGPLSLAQVVDFSLRNNPNTAISWANILKSIADLGLARHDFWPKVDVKSSIQRQYLKGGFSVQAEATQWLTLGGVSGSLTYTLWDFGARNAESASAVQALFAMSYAYNQELQSTIKTVTNDYYNLLYNKAALHDRNRDVEDSFALLQAAEKKLHLGIANITDLVQAKSYYLSAQVDFVTQKDTTENSLASLAKNMGMAANLEFQTQDFPTNLPGAEFLTKCQSFIDLALQNRPELIQYKAEILSKKSALTYSRLEPLPKLTGEIDLDFTAYHNYPNAFAYTGLFRLEMPFFDGFFYRNKIRQAKADLKKAEANFKQTQDNILKEVTSYFNNYKNSVEKIQFTQEYLDAAYEEFEVTLGNYKAGTGDILDVLQALTSLADARSKFTLSIQELFVSLTNLAYATGSLITPPQDSDWQGVYQFNQGP